MTEIEDVFNHLDLTVSDMIEGEITFLRFKKKKCQNILLMPKLI